MDLNLKDKVVLIAGSSKGIGFSIAEKFLDEGAKVTITGRNQSDVNLAVEQLSNSQTVERIFGFSGDLTKTSDIELIVNAILSKWTKIDILAANIGSGRGNPGWDVNQPEWNNFFQMNLSGSYRLAQRIIAYMINDKIEGAIIFTSSIAGLENLGAPMPYEISKAGLLVMSKYLARHLANHQIRINSVVPGNILFPGSTWENKLKQDYEGTMSYIKSEVPLQSFGTPEDVANAILFLSSDKARFITGTHLVVDGGQTKSFL